MEITIRPGTYIVAVSGGVDSMVLLDLLAKHRSEQTQPLRIIVAHFDHGIRPDSGADRLFVQQMAKHYGLPFVFDQVQLGKEASETKARDARYKFLEKARRAANASAIVTAHHRDDQLETAFINTLRGTGRRGLTSLRTRPTLLRPLLGTRKSELIDYAKLSGLKWREDSTNADTRYLRNHVRRDLLSTISPADQDHISQTIAELTGINDQIDQLLVNHLHAQPEAGQMDRHWFVMLPHNVATEVMMAWLRANGITDIDKKRIEMLTAKAKTLAAGKSLVVNSESKIKVGKHRLALMVAER